MNQQRFYSKDIQGRSIRLTDQEAVHCSLVLRKKEGDIIYVLDGKGQLHKCVIDALSKREVSCTILASKHFEQTETLHLAVAPTKNRDRLEWLVEKVVELGVCAVYFLKTERTERSRINMERIEKKAIAAMKQSLRHYLPEFKEVDLKDLMDTAIDERYIAHCEETQDKQNARNLHGAQDKLVLVGPEGDFTVEEIETALGHGFIPLDLGPARLRTETAALSVAVLANA